jgi:hypothetical protein
MTNITALGNSPRPCPQRHRGQQRMLATCRETDVTISKEQREYQVACLKDQQAHVAINSETLV